MLNSNKLTVVLAVILIGVSALTAFFAWQNVRMTGRWFILQDARRIHDRQQATVNKLAQEVVAYGRKQPDILPIMEALGYRLRATTNSPAAAPQP